MKTCLAFAGKIASGKSTIAHQIALELSVPHASFGNYVRKVAAERCIEPTRENLQDIGAELLKSNAVEFCKLVLDQVNWQKDLPIIIDGVRHLEVLDILKNLVHPLPLLLIFVESNESLRKERMVERENIEFSQIDKIDHNKTEEEVLRLRDKADMIIRSELSTNDMIKEIYRLIEKD